MNPRLARNLAENLAEDHADEARAKELDHLKLALATFALQLDAFEMRTHGLLLTVGKPGNLSPPRNSNRGPRKDERIGGQ